MASSQTYQMKQRKRNRKLLSVLLFFILVLLSGCERRSMNRYQAQFLDLFNTVTSIIGYAKDEETFRGYVQKFYDELEIYHQLYDIYSDYEGINNIKTINDNAGIKPVLVDEKIIDLLEEAVRMHKETNGRMNIAMGSVLEIWHSYREYGAVHPETASLPPMDELEAAAAHTDISQIQIDRQASTVYLADAEMKLDVGAIAKGYAVEMCSRMLEEEGISHMLFSVGGNIRGIGTRPDGTKWKVGIQNPDMDKEEAYLCQLETADMSVATSGSYQRYYTVEGVRYHHIIHPDLLMPWDQYVSVSVLCPDSGLADALSTALFNMELEEGRGLVEEWEDVEAMWISADKTQIYSSKFQDYIVK